MSEPELIKRKLAHWVERSADATEEELREACVYLQKILEIQADIKDYRFHPDMQVRIGDRRPDVFTQDKVAILAELRVYLTEQQELERLREEAAERVAHLARSLASDRVVCEWIDADNEEGGYEETAEQARERVKAELAQAEASYRQISERLREMKEPDRD